MKLIHRENENILLKFKGFLEITLDLKVSLHIDRYLYRTLSLIQYGYLSSKGFFIDHKTINKLDYLPLFHKLVIFSLVDNMYRKSVYTGH
ncbi:hypothetical protein A9Q99_01320 [Gammaproteobacteria bacterium 45_16_T64]|nr:hypothetical protein A9Q99_01320 [Gammaproteobacteria bacterium 45_16_T64]